MQSCLCDQTGPLLVLGTSRVRGARMSMEQGPIASGGLEARAPPRWPLGLPNPKPGRGSPSPSQCKSQLFRSVTDILAPHPQRPPDSSWGRPNLRGPWQALWKVRWGQEEQQELSNCGRWDNSGESRAVREQRWESPWGLECPPDPPPQQIQPSPYVTQTNQPLN